MNYQFLVVDVDGTLVDRSQTVSEVNKEAIRRLREAGYLFTLATGRMEASAAPFAEALGITCPLILYNGAKIVDVTKGETLWERSVDPDVGRKVADRCERLGITLNLYWEREIYVAEVNETVRRFLAKDRCGCREVGSLVRWLDERPSVHPTKMLLIGEEHELQRFQDGFDHGGRAETVRSDPEYLEVLPAGVSKGAALTVLTERLGIPLAATVAMGDHLNDLEMLRTAGMGVAVANAHPELRAAADRVTVGHEDGAVARVIDEFFLREASA